MCAFAGREYTTYEGVDVAAPRDALVAIHWDSREFGKSSLATSGPSTLKSRQRALRRIGRVRCARRACSIARWRA